MNRNLAKLTAVATTLLLTNLATAAGPGGRRRRRALREVRYFLPWLATAAAATFAASLSASRRMAENSAATPMLPLLARLDAVATYSSTAVLDLKRHSLIRNIPMVEKVFNSSLKKMRFNTFSMATSTGYQQAFTSLAMRQSK